MVRRRAYTAPLAFQPSRLRYGRVANYRSTGRLNYSVFKEREVGYFALRQMPLGKLSLHLRAIEKGQIVTRKRK